MTTEEMLQKLVNSKNEGCAYIAKRILRKHSTIEKELEYAGSFMTFVLKGDYDNALKNADQHNRKALLS
jgi:alanyl-tRNA synthetase